MVWEGTPLDSVREKLTQMDIHSVVFSPAANRSVQHDYFAVMENNLLRLTALAKQSID